MGINVQIKRSSAAGNLPAGLLPGELAVNLADGKLFAGDEQNQIIEVSPLRTGVLYDDKTSYKNGDIISVGGESYLANKDTTGTFIPADWDVIGTTSLADLTDTTIQTPQAGDILSYGATGWEQADILDLGTYS